MFEPTGAQGWGSSRLVWGDRCASRILFGITRNEKDDWFDPFLSLDTRLFIDPFLVYKSERGDLARKSSRDSPLL